MIGYPDGFVELHNADTGATWVGPLSYAESNPAWRPVDGSIHVPSLADGTIPEVLDAVGSDPVRAASALEAERAGKNRTTLVDRLTEVLDENPKE